MDDIYWSVWVTTRSLWIIHASSMLLPHNGNRWAWNGIWGLAREIWPIGILWSVSGKGYSACGPIHVGSLYPLRRSFNFRIMLAVAVLIVAKTGSSLSVYIKNTCNPCPFSASCCSSPFFCNRQASRITRFTRLRSTAFLKILLLTVTPNFNPASGVVL